jgi:hypothetical protein
MVDSQFDDLHNSKPGIGFMKRGLAEAYQATGRATQAEQTLASAQQIADQDPGNGHAAQIIARARTRISDLKSGHPLHCGVV